MNGTCIDILRRSDSAETRPAPPHVGNPMIDSTGINGSGTLHSDDPRNGSDTIRASDLADGSNAITGRNMTKGSDSTDSSNITNEISAIDSSNTSNGKSATDGSSRDGNGSPPDPEKKLLLERDCYDKLGFSYPTRKKWTILSVIFVVQVSMNFNASVYASSVRPIAEHFNVSETAARLGQAIFLLAYGAGSELWAPWSEEFGRWPVLQLSLFLVNVWQVLCALAPNYGSLIVGRFLGGLCSAGGSVTLGMVADMWAPDDQQYAVAFIVLSSVGGSAVGPIAGGFIGQYLPWYWNFWIQLIFGVVAQGMHFFVPETRTMILVDREAKKRRKAGEHNLHGPIELKETRLTMKEVLTLWYRPFKMFVCEPIVLWLSLLSGFSDALIFTFLDGFGPVYKQWGFDTAQTGLVFIAYVLPLHSTHLTL